MADLGKAYVQIIPKAEGITSKMNSLLGGAGKSAGGKAGKEAGDAAGLKLLSSMKKALTAAAIGTPIVAGIKTALSQGSELEQNLGGTEAVFGNSLNTSEEVQPLTRTWVRASLRYGLRGTNGVTLPRVWC